MSSALLLRAKVDTSSIFLQAWDLNTAVDELPLGPQYGAMVQRL